MELNKYLRNILIELSREKFWEKIPEINSDESEVSHRQLVAYILGVEIFGWEDTEVETAWTSEWAIRRVAGSPRKLTSKELNSLKEEYKKLSSGTKGSVTRSFFEKFNRADSSGVLLKRRSLYEEVTTF